MKSSKKRGFTLVELLAVIVVLAIIIGIVMMSSTTISKNSKEKLYEKKKDIIIKTASLYFDDHKNLVNTCISVQDLLNKGYIKKDTPDGIVEDPRDKNPMNQMEVCKNGRTISINEEAYNNNKDYYRLLREAIKKYVDDGNPAGSITVQELVEEGYLDPNESDEILQNLDDTINFDENGNITDDSGGNGGSGGSGGNGGSGGSGGSGGNGGSGNDSVISCSIVVSNKDSWTKTKTLMARVVNTGNASLTYSWDGENYTDSISNKTVSEVGTYTYRVKKTNGEIITCSATVEKIEQSAPTMTLTVQGDTTYEKTKTIEPIVIKDSGSGLASGATIKYGWSTSKTQEPTSYKDAMINYTSGTTADVKAMIQETDSLTGDFYLWVKSTTLMDKAGNSNNTTIISDSTFKFDNTAPGLCSIDYQDSSQASWNSAKTLVIGTATDAQTNIVEYKVEKYINGETTVIKDYQRSNPGSVTASESGTYTLYLRDGIGNETSCSKQVENVDLDAPTMEIDPEYSSDDEYTKDKTVKVNIKDNVSGLASGASIKYGWSTSKTQGPTTWTTVNPTYTEGTKDSVSFDVVGTNITGSYYLWVVPITLKDVATNSFTNNVISQGIYKFDNQAPSCNIVKQSVDEYGQINLVIEATDSDSGLNEMAYSWNGTDYYDDDTLMINENKTYTAYVKDKLNNVGTCSKEINEIDTIKPIITISKNSETTYSKTKSLNVTIQDADIGLADGASILYGLSDSRTTPPELLNSLDFTYTVGTKNTVTSEITIGENYSGKYYLWVYPSVSDLTGNTIDGNTPIISTGQFYFDNDEPTCVWGEWDKSFISEGQTATVSLTCTDDDSGITMDLQPSDFQKTVNINTCTLYTVTSVVKGGTNTARTYDVTVTASVCPDNDVTNAGIYIDSQKISDAVGNKIADRLDSPNNLIIDTNAPTCEITGIPTEFAESATLTVTGTDNGTGLDTNGAYSWNGTDFNSTNTLNINQNGDYTAYVKDAAGHIGSCTARVDRLEKIYECHGNDCPKCVRATKLHTAICDSESGKGCQANGYTLGQTITYGNLNNDYAINAGDAFDCDVNGDGKYIPSTERFYYVSNAWINGEFDSNVAALVASNNYDGSHIDNNYGVSWGGVTAGPTAAIYKLPTSSDWSNVALSSSTRNIYGVYTLSSTPTVLKSNFSYEGYSSRLLTAQEILQACPSAGTSITSTCSWLLENTIYQDSNFWPRGIWTETGVSSSDQNIRFLSGSDGALTIRYVNMGGATDRLAGVRPAIEVSYSDIRATLPASEYLDENAGDELIDDETEEHVERYTGANPNNYIYFNNELWRIIGKYDDSLKIIKKDSIGGMHYNDTSGNTWSTSSLNSYLNSTYYDGLTETAKNMIVQKEWYAGGTSRDTNASQAYTNAKGTITTGYVGIKSMYEYLFAGDKSCWTETGKDYSESCVSKNWLKLTTNSEWTMTPNSGYPNDAMYVSNSGNIGSGTINSWNYNINPVVYLKPDIIIKSGTGTYDDPYIPKIDDTAPTCEITGIPTEYAESATLTVVATDGESGIHQTEPYSWDGTNYSTTNTLEINENGDYTAYVKDKLGNIGSCTARVDKLEKIYECHGNDCPKCVRTNKLDTAICDSESGKGCQAAGYTLGQTITYGNLTNDYELKAGDAFDCDVNGNGKYEPSTERFYYVSDAWRNGTFNSNVAVLIAANSYNGGTIDNSTTIEYNSESLYKPDTLKSKLPTTSQWGNVKLELGTSRNIYNVNGVIKSENYDYSGYAARLLTYQEVLKVNSSAFETTGSLDNYTWLLENTKFQDSSMQPGYWLETVWHTDSESIKMATDISGNFRNMYRQLISYTPNNTVRPAIEVLYSDIKKALTPKEYIDDEDLVDDETDDHILRYTGSDPHNYVKFNYVYTSGELWRIIGIYGDKLKIMKTPNEYDNTNRYSEDLLNDWSYSALQLYLNNNYYDTLASGAKLMIDDGTWYVGASSIEKTALEAFNDEKQKIWTGKVGLMSMSEYMYAAGSECWDSYYYCKSRNWMNNGTEEWTITPHYSAYYYGIIKKSDGRLDRNYTSGYEIYHPVVYLKDSVIISSGSGTVTDPYILKIEGEGNNYSEPDTEAPSKPTLSLTLSNSQNISNSKTIYASGGSTDNEGISKYVISYGTTASTASGTYTIPTDETTFNYPLYLDLNANGNTYYFKVCAYDTSNNSSCSDVISKTLNTYRAYSTTTLSNVTTTTYGTIISEVISITGYVVIDNYTNPTSKWWLAFNVYSTSEPPTTNWVDKLATPKRCSYVISPVRTTYVGANNVTTRASTWSFVTQERTYTDPRINRTGSCVWSTDREIKTRTYSAGTIVNPTYQPITATDTNTSVAGRTYIATSYELN